MIGLCRRAVHLAAGELFELCKSLICEVPLHAYFLPEIGFEMTCFVHTLRSCYLAFSRKKQ